MDVEAGLIAFLRESGFEAFADVPAEDRKPDEYVTVERTGGSLDSEVIDRATVAVQCWARRRNSAAALASTVDEAMRELPSRPWVAGVRRNSLHNFPTGAGEPRYQIVYDVTALAVHRM